MKLMYEFIGTFFLVLTVGMTVIDPTGVGVMAPLAIGAILAVMVFAGGHISGAHYNPAVSLAVYLRGKLKAKDLFSYWIVQLIAGVAAAWMTIYLNGSAYPAAAKVEVMRALVSEFLFTFALCYVVLNVATASATQNNSYFGWAIGFTVLAGAYAVGAVSGGAFNPAVALGITIMNLTSWANLWIFVVGNLAGGAASALVFKIAHPSK
jgi:aquaporin Z